MPSYKDQCGNIINLEFPPQRIVSLVPSQTELLHFLGLEREVKGITSFCVHPAAWQKEKERVGGTKKIKPEVIRSLQPDLILANKEENTKEEVERLQEEFSVWVSDVKTLDDSLDMILAIGEITDKAAKAKALITEIKTAFNSLKSGPQIPVQCIPTAYLIWRKPYMAAGGDTFIHHMMQYCHFSNVFADRMRYPVVDISQIKNAGCKLLLLSSEPYPFSEKHVKELEESLPAIRIMLVDGEMFSWYGSRMLKAANYFRELISILQSRSFP